MIGACCCSVQAVQACRLAPWKPRSHAAFCTELLRGVLSVGTIGDTGVADTILITGGPGFIGRHVARACLERGHRVRVLDSLIEQVHGDAARADRLDPEVEFVVGDVRDEAAVRARAARASTRSCILPPRSASARACTRSTATSRSTIYGTAVLFQQLIDNPSKRVVVASSMSIYGEGLYRDADGRLVEDVVRAPRAARGRSLGSARCAGPAARARRRRRNGSARRSPPSTPSPNTCRSGSR